LPATEKETLAMVREIGACEEGTASKLTVAFKPQNVNQLFDGDGGKKGKGLSGKKEKRTSQERPLRDGQT